jgi:hypothetical protein
MIIGRDGTDWKKPSCSRRRGKRGGKHCRRDHRPAFYAALFGPLGAIGYRAINTMDSSSATGTSGTSTLGGRPRVDDVVNFSCPGDGLLVPVAAFLLRLRARCLPHLSSRPPQSS